jgi:hypothetical protein
LVISKITKFRQVKNWSFLHDFIIVIVVNLNDTLSNEVDFLDIALVADDNSSRSIKSAEHIDDQFISEASLTLVEEMVERFFKLLEHSGVLDQLSLHLWRDLLIE